MKFIKVLNILIVATFFSCNIQTKKSGIGISQYSKTIIGKWELIETNCNKHGEKCKNDLKPILSSHFHYCDDGKLRTGFIPFDYKIENKKLIVFVKGRDFEKIQSVKFLDKNTLLLSDDNLHFKKYKRLSFK